MLAKVAMLKQEKEQMLKKIARLQEENSCLKNDVQEKTFGFMFLNKGRSDFRAKFYTGLPNYEAFQFAYKIVLTFADAIFPFVNKRCHF